jgi:hypothetical protein
LHILSAWTSVPPGRKPPERGRSRLVLEIALLPRRSWEFLTMRVAALAADHRFEVVSVDDPIPAPKELIVAVRACGVCGSDLRSYPAPPAGGPDRKTVVPPGASRA